LGIPVILSDQCGCYGPKDVFSRRRSGVLYPCGDVQKLAESIARLADNQDLRIRMGRRARSLRELHSARAAAGDSSKPRASQFLAAPNLDRSCLAIPSGGGEGTLRELDDL